MKRKFNILLLTLLFAFASCSFTAKTFENSDKDKLLVQLITYVLEQGHFDPKNMDDTFSEGVFNDYLEQLDPFKRYFFASDIKEFEKYKYEIDDQLMNYDLSFFNLTHERLLQRIEDSKTIYQEILENPFDYAADETFSTDYENMPYVRNKKQLRERWRNQLKFSSIANYHDLIEEQERDMENLEKMSSAEREKALNPEEGSIVKKSLADIEMEAREATMRSLDELYDFIDDRQRKDWFSVYINAVVEEFDPHTFYFAPEDKDRFDVAMSGNYRGIGARLQKRMDNIIVNEIISGGPAWRQDKLEVGDQILKVRQEDEEEAVSIVGMRLDDAVKLIKGPEGTNVILTLKKVDGTVEELTITRDIVELEETYAKSSIVKKEDKTYGVINLPKFYVDFNDYDSRNAASDVKKEIERLKARGMEGLVLDLRNNGGGSLKTVVDMAGLFIKEGPVVQVRSTGEPKEVLRDRDRSIIWDGPLVILVNELSASASEILA
ncbi:MAG: PDZ domain-containing protein, partial [Flavobacteriaceae bacterium]|nr:PDZ domain-containing protein [Flavobacteriaceae bacterium]